MIYILVWNIDKWGEERMQTLIESVASNPKYLQPWKFFSHKKVRKGDRVFLMRTGQRKPGLVASGHVAKDAYEDPDFEDPRKAAWYVGVRFDRLIQKPTDVIVSKSELAGHLKRPAGDFTPRASGMPYKGNSDELEAYWAHLTGTAELHYPDEIPVANDNPHRYPEGALKTVTVNRYERNPDARAKCLEIHGTNCMVCGVNLSLIYGPKLAKNYIHVHHLKPLSEIREGYEVDPDKDLVPLCPNCHAMIHLTDDPSDVDALRDQIGSRTLKVLGQLG